MGNWESHPGNELWSEPPQPPPQPPQPPLQPPQTPRPPQPPPQPPQPPLQPPQTPQTPRPPQPPPQPPQPPQPPLQPPQTPQTPRPQPPPRPPAEKKEYEYTLDEAIAYGRAYENYRFYCGTEKFRSRTIDETIAFFETKRSTANGMLEIFKYFEGKCDEAEWWFPTVSGNVGNHTLRDGERKLIMADAELKLKAVYLLRLMCNFFGYDTDKKTLDLARLEQLCKSKKDVFRRIGRMFSFHRNLELGLDLKPFIIGLFKSLKAGGPLASLPILEAWSWNIQLGSDREDLIQLMLEAQNDRLSQKLTPIIIKGRLTTTDVIRILKAISDSMRKTTFVDVSIGDDEKFPKTSQFHLTVRKGELLWTQKRGTTGFRFGNHKASDPKLEYRHMLPRLTNEHDINVAICVIGRELILTRNIDFVIDGIDIAKEEKKFQTMEYDLFMSQLSGPLVFEEMEVYDLELINAFGFTIDVGFKEMKAVDLHELCNKDEMVKISTVSLFLSMYALEQRSNVVIAPDNVSQFGFPEFTNGRNIVEQVEQIREFVAGFDLGSEMIIPLVYYSHIILGYYNHAKSTLVYFDSLTHGDDHYKPITLAISKVAYAFSFLDETFDEKKHSPKKISIERPFAQGNHIDCGVYTAAAGQMLIQHSYDPSCTYSNDAGLYRRRLFEFFNFHWKDSRPTPQREVKRDNAMHIDLSGDDQHPPNPKIAEFKVDIPKPDLEEHAKIRKYTRDSQMGLKGERPAVYAAYYSLRTSEIPKYKKVDSSISEQKYFYPPECHARLIQEKYRLPGHNKDQLMLTNLTVELYWKIATLKSKIPVTVVPSTVWGKSQSFANYVKESDTAWLVLVPSETHFTCAFIYLERTDNNYKAVLFDSLKNTNEQITDKVLKLASHVGKIKRVNEVQYLRFNSAKQHNSYDCGVFCCIAGEIMANFFPDHRFMDVVKKISEISQSDMYYYRQNIADDITNADYSE